MGMQKYFAQLAIAKGPVLHPQPPRTGAVHFLVSKPSALSCASGQLWYVDGTQNAWNHPPFSNHRFTSVNEFGSGRRVHCYARATLHMSSPVNLLSRDRAFPALSHRLPHARPLEGGRDIHEATRSGSPSYLCLSRSSEVGMWTIMSVMVCVALGAPWYLLVSSQAHAGLSYHATTWTRSCVSVLGVGSASSSSFKHDGGC